MARSAYENLRRTRESLARVRTLFEQGRADPWQVAEAELKHERARELALGEGPELQLALVDIPSVATPALPIPVPKPARRR